MSSNCTHMKLESQLLWQKPFKDILCFLSILKRNHHRNGGKDLKDQSLLCENFERKRV